MYTYCPYCSKPLANPTPPPPSCPHCNEPKPPAGWAKDPLVHTTVDHGRYLVKRRIGAGGFGAVYEVQRTQANYRRAMKVLGQELAIQPHLQRQFIEEAEILNELDHPNIVRCHEVGILHETSQPFMLLELLEGDNLFDLIWPPNAQRPNLLPIDSLLAIGIQVCDALHAAHSIGMLHRDLKPENIFVLNTNNTPPKIKVIDFGIAKILGPGTGGSRTKRVIGTPEYMAPEQFQPGLPLDGRLDLYQLGAVLHFIATGYPPYDAGNTYTRIPLLQMERKDSHGPRPSEFYPPFAQHPGVDQLIGQLLSTQPDQRPNSAQETATTLRALRDSTAANPTPPIKTNNNPTPTTTEANNTPPRTDDPPTTTNNHDPQPLHTLSEPLRPRTLVPYKSRPTGLQESALRRAETQRVNTIKTIIQGAFALLIIGLGVAIFTHLQKPEDTAQTTAETNSTPDPLSAPAIAPNPATEANNTPPRTDNPENTTLTPPPTPNGFVLVQPGTFTMGSSTTATRGLSETKHDVQITRPFFIQKHEVTRNQWRSTTNLEANHFRSANLEAPVESVSWFDALYYLNTLSKNEGLEACYTLQECTSPTLRNAGCKPEQTSCSSSFACRRVDFSGLDCRGYRLPTEAEWEYATRAGDPQDRYGDPERISWFAANSDRTIHTTQTRSPNAWGLYDLYGNVSEWTWDGAAPSSPKPTQDPLGSATSPERILRGGHWGSVHNTLRASARMSAPPTQRSNTIGFRAVRTALP